MPGVSDGPGSAAHHFTPGSRCARPAVHAALRPGHTLILAPMRFRGDERREDAGSIQPANSVYCALMPAARITFAQVAISDLIRAANSAGVLAIGSKP